MAIKKGVKKATKKKVVVKKPVSKKKVQKKISPAKKEEKRIETKKGLALRKLGLFLALFIISLGLYGVSENTLYTNLFAILSILFGFIIIAMVISYLAFIILKNVKK